MPVSDADCHKCADLFGSIFEWYFFALNPAHFRVWWRLWQDGIERGLEVVAQHDSFAHTGWGGQSSSIQFAMFPHVQTIVLRFLAEA